MPKKMRILIAYDGSDCAGAALEDLQWAGLPQSAEALIISVADVFPPPQMNRAVAPAEPVAPAVRRAWAQAEQTIAEAQAMALQALARVKALFPAWEARAEAWADSPAWGIIKQADTWQPDLIVVGSHGRSALGRLLPGSISYKVVTEADCSVRIARGRPHTEEEPLRLVLGVDGSADAAAAVQAVAARTWPANSQARLVAVLDPRLATALAPPSPAIEGWAEATDEEVSAWVYTR